jgi:hypothetical protein
VQAESKALEQRQLSAISDRIAVRVQGHRKLKAHSCSDPGDEVHGRGTWIRPFGTFDSRRTHADPAGDLADTQSGREPRRSELVGETVPEESTPVLAVAALSRPGTSEGSEQPLVCGSFDRDSSASHSSKELLAKGSALRANRRSASDCFAKGATVALDRANLARTLAWKSSDDE